MLEIQVKIENFGDNFAITFNGHSHLSTNQFNSNLMMQNFIIVDVTNNVNNVIIYDELDQGKDVE